MRHDGKSWKSIFQEIGVKKSTAQQICKAPSSRTTRKGKAFKPKLLDLRTIREIIRYIGTGYSTRRMRFEEVRLRLGKKASARTIRRELRKHGYRRCIACPRPFISRAQAKKRVSFAYAHRWWRTSDNAAHRDDGKVGGDWRRVIWSDESTFDLGKDGRVWVTRRVDEKRCITTSFDLSTTSSETSSSSSTLSVPSFLPSASYTAPIPASYSGCVFDPTHSAESLGFLDSTDGLPFCNNNEVSARQLQFWILYPPSSFLRLLMAHQGYLTSSSGLYS